ncbi:MAG: AAA family ATPase [Candidatus Omnitrophota bacterium]
MNWKKTKRFFRLYWLRMLLWAIASIALILLVILLVKGIKAWFEAESYVRQSQLAMYPLQIFIWVIVGAIQTTMFVFMLYWMQFKKGGQQFTHSNKKSVSGKDVGIHWSDVIGMDEAKEEALEVVNLIRDRAELQRIGGRILRGLLMLGPPGCGKTYLAKAIATEAGMPFISMSGSEFVEMFVGVGAGRIRNLFKSARELAEIEGGCIIFIDELDALGARRGIETGGGGTTEHNQTLNQLLVEMDGLKEKDTNVVIIGATNAPENYLDIALLRPGRFDRKIYVDKPSLEDRQKLFEYYLKEVKYDQASVKTDRLARITVGNSPADIANIVRESALIAVRRKKNLISMKEIDDARERISLGIKRRIKVRQEEKLQAAYHEAGHAIVTYLLVPTQDVFKVTITPRGYTGGATWTPEKEEIFIPDRQKLLGEIKTCLGSYAAERLKLGTTTAGVDSDFKKALYIAHNMVWRWGMGKSGVIGNFHVFNNAEFVSESTRNRLDIDVQDILNTCLREVEELLHKEDAILERLAKELIAKEELNYDEIEAIFKEFGKNRP